MPCNSDYLEPTEREQELRRAARLLIFALEAQGREAPDWARSEAENLYAKDERSVTSLCALIKSMGEPERDRIVYDAKSKASRDLADWWEEHQEADRRREEREAAEARREADRRSALGKLTEEEKAALGV